VFRIGLSGVVLGAAAGAVAGVVLAKMRPDLSLFAHLADTLSNSPLLAALEGGLLGAVAFGLLGTLLGLGHWRQVPAPLEKQGGIEVGVRTQSERVQNAIRALKPVSVHEVLVQQDG